MKIVTISDTHQLHNRVNLPEGDVLVHCGDFTNKGTEGAIKEFLTWFSAQPHEYKVFIAGNHELGLDMGPNRAKKLSIITDFTSKDSKMTYLENSEVIINDVKFYGSPITPWFFNWAWNVRRGAPIAAAWDLIPNDTQVLLTHGPAYGILDLVTESYGRDMHQGCQDLKNKIDSLSSLKLHVCGHLHLQGGLKTVVDEKIFVNAAICDDEYNTTRSPVVIDL